MIRPLLTFTLLAAAIPTAAFADDIRFPYEATVASDNVNVHSGPGRRYYPANKLNRGERVIVHRHDPGGWYMIEPPPSSFSWIRADYVKRTGKNRGVVIENNVVVWVGSDCGPDHDVTQRKLSINDTVEILGEETITTPDKSVRMLKIAPPRNEYRWILAKYIIPTDASIRREHDRDPFAVPSNALRLPDAGNSYPGLKDGDDDDRRRRHDDLDASHRRRGKAVQPNGPGIDVMQAEKDQLRQLDDDFRVIIHRPTLQWEFSHLEDDYRDLYDAVERPAMKKQIAMRLDAVERYQRTRAEYEEFVQLTMATDRRDQRLLNIQRGRTGAPMQGRMPVYNASTPRPYQAPAPRPVAPQVPYPVAEPMPGDFQPPIQGPIGPPMQNRVEGPVARPMEAPRPVSNTMPTMPTISVPGAQGGYANPPRPSGDSARNEPPFDGAGVIQRAAFSNNGAPQHVLLAPGGKILAYLAPEPGVNLDKHVGQSMGVRGKRVHRQDLNADFILVHRLAPVRLLP